MLLKNISLKKKLLGGFLLISCLVLVTSLISINNTNKIVGLFEDIVHTAYPRYNTLLTIKTTANEIRNQTLIISSGAELTFQTRDEQKDEILANVEKIQSNIDIYEQHISTDESTAILKLNKISAITDTMIESAFQLIALREQQASTSAVAAVEKQLHGNQQILQTEIDAVVDEELKTIAREDQAAEDVVSQTISNMYIVSFMAVLLAIAGGFSLSIPIVTKIRNLRNAASEVAKGNLDIRLNETSRDELGQLSNSFDQMTQNLKEINEEKEKNQEELTKKSAELAQKIKETEDINKLMTGRELKMIEMKKEIEELKKS